ncbi:3,4-dihydroxy 2-butanone 4-phosphate synthase/GTP cyclohydrolase II [Actinopolyspora biskrensis]|uniref:GTP cyclohydrolase II n=1 Tax=Actinopolyspora biskrensis TaxID=1470178 RepID=A0A852YTT9_9ACTN|nr:3,4-dihydroxy 2-butanone 4-phosphate synthase/GTP cyclohydrolase II [Actinopolyspora biskrensis]
MHTYLALIVGDIADGDSVLTRIHSECLTGDSLGSLHCDCGVQLHATLSTIRNEGRGVLLYVLGHEGRGVGLLNKLRAYALQEQGADTVEANTILGFAADTREFSGAAAVLKKLGVNSVRLITNNDDKADSLKAEGVDVECTVPAHVASHSRHARYSETKREKLGHSAPRGGEFLTDDEVIRDVPDLLGLPAQRQNRPYVIVKYAQTLDGRLATSTGDSKWISSEKERTLSHSMRAACDAVLVGIGTVLSDDPQLTVRMVPGNSPLRVVLDSRGRTPTDARVLDDGSRTVVITTSDCDPEKQRSLESSGVTVLRARKGPQGVDLNDAFRALGEFGVRTLLIEGGAEVITSAMCDQTVDRIAVSTSPVIVGEGRSAVGDLNIRWVDDALHLSETSMIRVDRDSVLFGTPHVKRPVPDLDA